MLVAKYAFENDLKKNGEKPFGQKNKIKMSADQNVINIQVFYLRLINDKILSSIVPILGR